MKNYVEELRWRGLIHEMIPGVEEYLLENQVAGYLGVDPTGDSIHIGNLVPVMMMVHLQRAGHKPIMLVGGATGRVGDPSGKDKERQLLSAEQIAHNVACIRKQLAQFVDFEAKDNAAEIVNNYDWFEKIGFIDFLRDVGKHITISYMMGKESVKKRMEGDAGISYTEFAYQLLQGYDFLHLYENKGVRIQVGGSDQWGNITTGTELIRRKLGSEEKAYAIVCPLMTREDGSKFGKSAEGKSVWLDPEKTSPYEFYQYWMNVSDKDAETYIKIFTLKEREEIEELVEKHQEATHLRGLQKALAEDITKRVHGKEGLESALKLTEFLFGRNTSSEALAALSLQDWKAITAVSDKKLYSREKLKNGVGILELLTDLGITKSNGEARRAIDKDKSIRINTERCEDINFEAKLEIAFYDTYFQLQKGKKNKFIVELTD
ncbi:MAG: tyrosine--tRNA ligase [Bacteroidia bacterium]|nr:tyrosine--tRNA ligase [Bacteroidia bacterium]